MPSEIKLPQNVIIVTHELFYGAAQALRDYLVKHRISQLLYISHPLRQENPYTNMQWIKKGRISQKLKTKRAVEIPVLQYLTDFWLTVSSIRREQKEYEVYIGVNPLNALSGLLLKRLRLVRKVIFYAIDFTPQRFSSRILNKFYHWLEKFCVKNCDETWNVSPRISRGREKYLNIDPAIYPQKVVPIGLWENEIVIKSKKFDNQIGFAGHLLEKQGVQKVIEALAIVKDAFPEIKFIVIGGGEYLNQLKKLTKQLKLERNVIFTGWINNQEKIRKLLSACSLAVATYSTKGSASTNFTYYADPTKLKTYLACGLPIVMTNISYNAHEFESKGCANLVKYNTLDIANGILSYLQDKQALVKAQRRAIEIAKDYGWDKIFTQAFIS